MKNISLFCAAISQKCLFIILPLRTGKEKDPVVVSRSQHTHVTVCQINQIVSAILQENDIPHMTASVHLACYREAFSEIAAAEGAEIAQILKGLGISFADNICIRIAVKNIDQLPGVPIGRSSII